MSHLQPEMITLVTADHQRDASRVATNIFAAVRWMGELARSSAVTFGRTFEDKRLFGVRWALVCDGLLSWGGLRD